MTKNHWMDELVAAMRQDRHELLSALRDTYTDVKPLRGAVKKMSPKQELSAFLGMEQSDRQRMATEMGPEQYGQFVMGKMNQLVQQMGPAASKLMPYLMAPVEQGSTGEIDRDTLEAELLSMLSSEE